MPTEQVIASQKEKIRRQSEESPGAQGFERPAEWAEKDDYAQERERVEIQDRRYERQDRLQRSIFAQQLEQITFARRLAWISPMSLIDDLAERLVGSGPSRDRRFLDQTAAFRDHLRNYIRELDHKDPETRGVFLERYLSTRPIDASRRPRFEFHEISLRDGVQASRQQLQLLTLWTFLLAVIGWIAGSRFELR